MSDPYFNDDRTTGLGPNMWHAVANCLVGAALLILLSGAAYALGNDGTSFRQRLQTLSDTGAGVFTAVLLLAGILAAAPVARHFADRIALLFGVALAASGVVLLLSTFSVLNLATADERQFLTSIGGWEYRAAPIFQHLAAGLVSFVSLVIARRFVPFGGNRPV
jgi:hypothetical protein